MNLSIDVGGGECAEARRSRRKKGGRDGGKTAQPCDEKARRRTTAASSAGVFALKSQSNAEASNLRLFLVLTLLE